MGYCIRVEESKVTIRVGNKHPALMAIRALQGKETIKDSVGRHFSWVDQQAFLDAGTLEDMLREWRWEPKVDPETGDIIGVSFGGEKYGDDDLLFKTLAPYIEEGSYIIFRGEDGACWKFVFDGKTMKEVQARRVWDES